MHLKIVYICKKKKFLNDYVFRVRSQRPSTGSGRPGGRHGDGSDLHWPEERSEAGQNLRDHHQVRQSSGHVLRPVTEITS